jgi:hypothetical protein
LLTIEHFASIGSIEKEITWFVPWVIDAQLASR